MNALTILTADYAAVEPQTNKLNFLGVFRNIAAPSFPVSHRRMYLVARIAGKVDENYEPKKLTVSLENGLGEEIFRIESSFQLTQNLTGIPPEHNAIFELNGIEFKEPGSYLFRVVVNEGETEAVTHVHVVQNEA